MTFRELELPGVWLVGLEPMTDDRGWFARSFCRAEFIGHGLNPDIVQSSFSHNLRRGTLRGMHWQNEPHQETKFIRVVRGEIVDVLVDLRSASPTYLRSLRILLSEKSNDMLFVPGGVAHGFQTLVDETTVFYQMSACYSPEASRGFRWDDPSIGIAWPLPDSPILSPKDAAAPFFHPDLLIPSL